jgi:hypothetical protein
VSKTAPSFREEIIFVCAELPETKPEPVQLQMGRKRRSNPPRRSLNSAFVILTTFLCS